MGEHRYRNRWGFREANVRNVMNELKQKNEVKCGNAYIVRIPKIEGKIFIRDVSDQLSYVLYIYENAWDKGKKQMRNRKATIGQVLKIFPGAMLPNERYYAYFDRETGELKNTNEEDPGDENADGEQTENPQERPENDLEREAGELTYQEKRKMIQKVLENEGMMRREEGRLRKEIRAGCGPKEKEAGNGAPVSPPEWLKADKDLPPEERKRKRRIKILLDILTSMRDVIKDQARKRPTDIVNPFQAQKINTVLEEIRKIENELGYGEMLELIQEPREVDRDGKTLTVGMSYSDAELLMEYYNSIIWFTQSEM